MASLISVMSAQILVRLVHITECMSQSLHLLFWESSNNAGLETKASVLYISALIHAASVLFFLKKSNNSSEPTDCFVLARLISGYCPTSFEILYLSWERAFINILLIFVYCSLVSYLLSGPVPHGISQYTGSLLFARPPHDWTASLKKTREPGNILNQSGCRSVRWHVLFKGQTFTPLEEKKDVGDLQPNKDCKWSPVPR